MMKWLRKWIYGEKAEKKDPMDIDLNKLARQVALLEGGAQRLTIAQIKEVIGCLFVHIRALPPDEQYATIAALVKRAGKRSKR